MTRAKLRKVLKQNFDAGRGPRDAVKALLKHGTKDQVLLACIRFLDDLYVPQTYTQED